MKKTAASVGIVSLALASMFGVVSLSTPGVDPVPVVQAIDSERSPQWPTVRRAHLEQHPECEACGSRDNLNVHHIEPFHLNPARELDPTNLITLCRQHHLAVGHDPDGPEGPAKPNWSAANRNVRADSERLRNKLNPRH